MSEKKIILYLFLFLTISVCSWNYGFSSDYMKYKMVNVCVLDKKEEKYRYKGREKIRNHFILKDNQNRKFKKEVSLKLYNSKTHGSCFGFSLREIEIHPNDKSTLKYSTIPMILFSLSLSAFVSLLIFSIISIEHIE